MSLSVGIIGLPNAGKSTLFNALIQKQQALMASYPFATIEPNVGVVPVEDERLAVLAKIVATDKIVPATVKFVDIAGLVKGAATGEGLGNKFLAHIREVDLIVHVLRDFHSADVVQTGVDPKSDYETVKTELILADLATVVKQKEKGLERVLQALEQGKEVRELELTDAEEDLVKPLFLLTSKPVLFVINIDESQIKNTAVIEQQFPGWEVVAICAKMETELIEFEPKERAEYLKAQGLLDTGLNRLVKKAYDKLGLVSFLTAGKIEVRAWTVKVGTLAPEAAGVIHTDFTKKFIKANVVDYDKFVLANGWQNARAKGWVKSEGKDYQFKGDEVVEFAVAT